MIFKSNKYSLDIIKADTEGTFNVFLELIVEVSEYWIDKNHMMWNPVHLNKAQLNTFYNLDKVGNSAYIGYIDGIPAAGLIIMQSDDYYWGENSGDLSSIFLHKIAVSPKFRGHNLSRLLLDFAVYIAKELGRDYIKLDTHSGRAKLNELYINYGFLHLYNKEYVIPTGKYIASMYEYKIT